MAWAYKILLFIREADVVLDNKTSFATIFINNGSGETINNEKLLFDVYARLSTSGSLPVEMRGVEMCAKDTMIDGFRSLVEGLTNGRYLVISNTQTEAYADRELISHNFVTASPTVGNVVNWSDAIDFIGTELEMALIPG